MKLCPTCNIEKDESEFGKNSSTKDGLFYQCKECKREYDRKHYNKNREHILQTKREQYHNNIEHYKAYHREYDKKRHLRMLALRTPCVKCGEDKLYLIDYHHINPKDKLYNVNRVQHCNVGKEEIKKCVCLCRNCHTEYHYIYGNQPKYPIETLSEYIGQDPYTLIPQF